MKFKSGDLVSVWHRQSRRHKWKLEHSIVRLLSIDLSGDGDVVVQTSDSGVSGIGNTAFALRGSGTWERELRKPVLFPVIKRHYGRNARRTLNLKYGITGGRPHRTKVLPTAHEDLQRLLEIAGHLPSTSSSAQQMHK